MKRKMYDELLKWKNMENALPLMVIGVRQCGKTYLLNEFCQKEYKNYFYLNLFTNTDIVNLYKEDINSEEKFKRLKLYLNFDIEQDDTIVFIDEIQESEELIADLKYFCENTKVRIVCAGSLLGLTLSRYSKSFPVGKVKLLKMYPMSFEEFLINLGQENLVEEIRSCYKNNRAMVSIFHEKCLNYYRQYLIVGGMPASILSFINGKCDLVNYDLTILNDIYEEYLKDIKKHVDDKKDVLKIINTYNSIPMQLTNEANKFQYSKVKSGGKAAEFENVIDWLNASKLANVSYLVGNPEIPLEGFVKRDFFKLYLSDVGILNRILKIKPLDIILDKLSLYKGAIAENYVANELINLNYNLYYWQSNGIAEVDFLIYNNDGIIPVEVKAADNTQSKSLKTYIEKFKPNYSIRISSKNFGYNPELKIKTIPLYAIFCLEENI